MPVIRYTGDKSAVATIAETATDSPFRIEFCNTEKRFLPGHVIEGRVVFLWNRRWRTVQGKNTHCFLAMLAPRIEKRFFVFSGLRNLRAYTL